MSAVSMMSIILWLLINDSNGQLVMCNGDNETPCDCPSIPGEKCILDCGKEDICKEKILNCRGGDECEIRCDAKAACSSGAVINARTATDVTIICGPADDACKDEIDITCGTGHCQLNCNGKTSCESWGTIDVSKTKSFECVGDCPPEVPASFTQQIFNQQTIAPVIPGYYGQDCTYGIDDNPPDACVFGQIITDNGLGKVECSENYDCCLCKTIICGQIGPGGSSCEDFSCNGDQACLGVKDIRLYGDEHGGVTLSCNGDESCIGTKIIGTNIKEIGCSGDSACARSIFEFDCLDDEPCVVSCGGDNACAGNPKNSSLGTTRFTIGNTQGIECADEACKYGVFNLQSNSGGSILCAGEMACIEAEITINNIEGISCGGVDACKNAYFLVIDPMQDFSVECSGPHSCEGLTLEIVVNNGVNFFKGIGCGDFACIDAQFLIYNNNDEFITIENLECEAPSACTHASFDFDGGVGFENCKCGESSLDSCDGIVGISSCMGGIEKVECSGIGACSNLQQQIRNVENDFELICSDHSSCKSFWLQIVLNDNSRSNVNVIKGYKCDSHESCSNAIIQINNQQDDISVQIEKIDCSGVASCKSAVFIIDGDVNIQEIVCNGHESCYDCIVQHTSANTITPCANF